MSPKMWRRSRTSPDITACSIMSSQLLIFIALLSVVGAGPIPTRFRSRPPFRGYLPRGVTFPKSFNPKRVPPHLIPRDIINPYFSPSPSPAPSPKSSKTRDRPAPKAVPSPAPTDAVGKFLGLSGLETPEFYKRCKQCCRISKRKLRAFVPILYRCGRCRIKKSLEPPDEGRCRYRAPLGFSKTPSDCFYERCFRMLIAKGPCMCLVRF